MNEKIKITNYKKICIINTAFIGDIVLSFYLAQAIKLIHPNSEITFLTNPRVKDLAPIVTSIDEFIFYDKKNKDQGLQGIKKVANKLQEKNIELILSPHRSLRTSLITFLAKPKLSVSYSNSSWNFLYKRRVKYLNKSHEIERNLNLLSIFEEYSQTNFSNLKINIKFSQEISQQVKLKANIDFEKYKIVSIAPGSIWKTKQWTEAGYIHVAQELQRKGYQVILLGSKEDFEICQRIADETGAKNLAGVTNLAESAYIIHKSKLLITNDSSPTHIGTIVNCPTITIYGPTIPEFGFYPRAEKSIVIQVDSLGCKPCSIHGYNKCPLQHHKCMKDIDPKIVLKYAFEILGSEGKSLPTSAS